MKATRLKTLFAQETLPPSIKKSFVDTLFMQTETLVTGWVSQCAVCLLGYFNLGRSEFLYLIAVLTLILAVRMWDSSNFNRQMARKRGYEVTDAQIRIWRARYIIGSCSTALCLAFISCFTVWIDPGSLATLAAIGLALGTLNSVVGKNFGDKFNIDALVFITCAPMMLTLALKGVLANDKIMVVTALLLLPVMLIARQMARQVRGILYSSLTNLHHANAFRKLFEAALNYMPGGLIMIDDNDKVSIMNFKAARMFGIPDQAAVVANRTRLLRLVTLGMVSNQLTRGEASKLRAAIGDLMGGDSASKTVNIGDKHIQLTVNKLPTRTPKEDEAIGGAVLICEDVTLRVEAYERARLNANFDHLSGLPNRRYLIEQINEAVQGMGDEELIAIGQLDINKFKLINDNFGHATGDAAIRSVGQAINALETERMLRGRWGGDEFMIAILGLKDERHIKEELDKIFTRLCRRYEIADDGDNDDGVVMQRVSKLDIKCSGGVVICRKDSFVLEDAMKKADVALLTAKKEPDIGWLQFDEAMAAEYHKEQKLKDDFRIALREGYITPVYQPMYTPDGARLVCCEALARWHHPELGSIVPARFIPIAEQYGFIHELTVSMMNRACRDCAGWHDPTICVSVNLSAVDLANHRILDVIKNALTSANLDPNRLQIEVTESVFVKDRGQAAGVLRNLQDMGIRIAIDDFGTGYSNLALINDMPLDKLKIDRSFVENIVTDKRARTFFTSMVTFTKSLGFGIVVEGVETLEQLNIIQMSNVDLIQGYLFGRPMVNDDINARIDELLAIDKGQTGKKVVRIKKP